MRTTSWLLAAAALLAGCTATVPGTPDVPPSVGATQSSDRIDVTLVSYVDPAAIDESSTPPDDDERVVAAQFRVHNTSRRDYLVDPITEAALIAGGAEIDDSYVVTTAGVMLDQVSLPPDQTVLGYLTFTVPSDAPATQVRYQPTGKAPMLWQVSPGGRPNPPRPRPDARADTHPLGEPVTITDDEDSDARLRVAATKLTDPAQPLTDSDIPAGKHVVQVDLDVTAERPSAEEPDLRIVTLYDAQDQSARAEVDSLRASVDKRLTAGERTTWPVQFVVPDGFRPDRVSFRPEFGETTTTIWALS